VVEETLGPRVDVHLHLSPYWPDLTRTAYRPDLDYTVPSLLRELSDEKVGFGLVLPIYLTPTVEEALAEARENLYASGGRLLPTSTVDPTRGADEVARAIALWDRTPDLVALKLYPGYQRFYPHDRVLDPLYEFARRRQLVVMIHQGDTLDPNGLVKFARPVEIDEVAVRFRDVTFVLCHLGNPWIEETAEVVYKNANVYTDTSGLLAHPRVPHFEEMRQRAQRRLQNAIATIGDTSRILYGSDWPLESIAIAVGLVQGLDLEPAEQEAILGGNARRLFQLGRESPSIRPTDREQLLRPPQRPGADEIS
jgi:predicted TIM-barrel fold metal-dependent hydrolase